MIPTFLLVDAEMIPKELENGDLTWDCGILNNKGTSKAILGNVVN